MDFPVTNGNCLSAILHTCSDTMQADREHIAKYPLIEVFEGLIK